MDTCLSLSAGAGNYTAVHLVLDSLYSEDISEDGDEGRDRYGEKEGIKNDYERRDEEIREASGHKGEEGLAYVHPSKRHPLSRQFCCHHTPYSLNHHRSFLAGHNLTRCKLHPNLIAEIDTTTTSYSLATSATSATPAAAEVSSQCQRGFHGTEEDKSQQQSIPIEVNIDGILRNLQNKSLKRTVRARRRFNALCGVHSSTAQEDGGNKIRGGGLELEKVRSMGGSGTRTVNEDSRGSERTVLRDVLKLMR